MCLSSRLSQFDAVAGDFRQPDQAKLLCSDAVHHPWRDRVARRRLVDQHHIELQRIQRLQQVPGAAGTQHDFDIGAAQYGTQEIDLEIARQRGQ